MLLGAGSMGTLGNGAAEQTALAGVQVKLHKLSRPGVLSRSAAALCAVQGRQSLLPGYLGSWPQPVLLP